MAKKNRNEVPVIIQLSIYPDFGLIPEHKPFLQLLLDKSIDGEDYEFAAFLRDKINQ